MSPRVRIPAGLRVIAAGLGAIMAVITAALAGTGLLYGLRGLPLLGAGPRVRDALPLLQLAGFDGQPLARVLIAWLAAGLALGVVLLRIPPWRRALLTTVLAVALLLFASEIAFAVARNTPLASVLGSRRPGFGPVLEGMSLAAGALLPRPLRLFARPAWSAGLPARFRDVRRRSLSIGR